MRKATMLLLLAGLALFLGVRPASADPIALGNLSFNITVPSGVTPGEASFSIANYTGPLWEYAPYYPAASEVDFTNAALVIQFASLPSVTVDLGTVTPGFTDSSVVSGLGVSLADPVTSATFTATLDGLPLTLDSSLGGGSLNVSANLSGMLSDAGGSLQDGDNVDLIAGPQAVGTVPEPATLLLLASGLLLFMGLRRTRLGSL